MTEYAFDAGNFFGGAFVLLIILMAVCRGWKHGPKLRETLFGKDV